MAYKIVLSNKKGGVAKTTTAINIADALIFMGNRVLFLDLDSQCNSTSVFVGDSELETDKTVLNIFKKTASIKDCINHTPFGDIVCASKELENIQDELMRIPGGLKIIKKALAEVEDAYDYIIMDTPGDIGSFTRNALFAANGVIAPVEATKFALDGLADFIEIVEALREDGNESLDILGVLLTQFDIRNAQDREVRRALPDICDAIGVNFFKTNIRKNQDVEKAISSCVSLFRTYPNSNGANDYADLVSEIIEQINSQK